MVLALWVIQVLLALTFSNAASRKLVRQKGKPSKSMAWREDFSRRTVRLVGVLELLGAVGLVLPALAGVLPWLTPLAAAGLALTMIGAALTHLRRGEYETIPVIAVLMVLALFVAYVRFFVVGV
jgi:uncharacterized membrane protein YphA (DoxX/SURF4 family)